MFNVTKLSNGLTITTYNMPYVESVSINLIVRAGSRHEDQGEEGISHFLEHMAFKGTNLRSSMVIAEEFDAIGGHFNAYTSRERTVYYTKVLKDHYQKALTIIADIIQHSIFDAADIAKEYEVILQEIAEGQDDPEELGYEKFYNLAYKDHAMGRSILGTAESLKNFNKASFYDYLAKNYIADNIYLSLAGNINHNEAVKIAESLFANIYTGKAQDIDKVKYHGGCAYINKKLEQTSLIMGFESLSYLELEQFYHTQILSLILGGGCSSRLFQQIRENLGLVYGIGSYNSSYLDSGLFSICASTTHDKLPQLAKSIVDEINKIKEGVTQSELDRAIMQIKANIYMAQEQSSYKSEQIGKNYSIFKKYFSPKDLIDIIEQTTILDVQNAAAKIFTTKPTLVIVGPKKEMIDYDALSSQLSAT